MGLPLAEGAFLFGLGDGGGRDAEVLSDVGGGLPRCIVEEAEGGGVQHVPGETIVGVVGVIDPSETLCDTLVQFVECSEGRAAVDRTDGAEECPDGVDGILDHSRRKSRFRCATTEVTEVFVRRRWAEVVLNQNY
ncbi:MAG: hypothetical protein GY748_16585 [Planctomycetaceae bacterium]|nr:hypothetical protein [Planctomycetaceae bacterium]